MLFSCFLVAVTTHAHFCAFSVCDLVVSDAASGGQILMCERTFKAVQHQKEELGCVGREGMDYKRFHAQHTPWKLFSQWVWALCR
jgi:hypothetical protein